MSELRSELALRFVVLADRGDDSSWDEVTARAERLAAERRSRRPLLAVAVAAALAVLVAAPAVALRGKVIQLFGGAPPAPQRVVESMRELGGTSVQAGRAARVLETPVGDGVSAELFVAPSAGGGFCARIDLTGLGGAGAECVAPGDHRLELTTSLHGRVSPAGEVLSGPVLLTGETADPQAYSLRLRFEDGETTTVQLVWVSAPVERGFFVYGVPEQHWRAGHLPTTLSLLDAGGEELDSRAVHGIPTS